MMNLFKTAYHFLLRLVYFFVPIVFLIDFYNIYVGKYKENKALKIIQKRGYKVFNVSEIYESITPHRSKICHIVGLGWSLNCSKHLIKDDGFVIGMNYGALSDLKFDLYFVEQGLCDDVEAALRVRFIDEVVSKQATKIYYKNAWGPRKVEYVISNYAQRVTFLHSYSISCGHVKTAKFFMRLFLKKDNRYLKQYKSTVITSIALAKNAGFKKIVIHGLDFGGPYFYEDQSIQSDKIKFIPPLNSLSRGKTVHHTAVAKTGIQQAIPIIKLLLHREGVELLAASEMSPLAKMLDVFDDNNKI